MEKIGKIRLNWILIFSILIIQLTTLSILISTSLLKKNPQKNENIFLNNNADFLNGINSKNTIHVRGDLIINGNIDLLNGNGNLIGIPIIGMIGAPGQNGFQGSPGAVGIIGPTGNQGFGGINCTSIFNNTIILGPGQKGPPGINGTNGFLIQGPSGIQGNQGIRGLRGMDGTGSSSSFQLNLNSNLICGLLNITNICVGFKSIFSNGIIRMIEIHCSYPVNLNCLEETSTSMILSTLNPIVNPVVHLTSTFTSDSIIFKKLKYDLLSNTISYKMNRLFTNSIIYFNLYAIE